MIETLLWVTNYLKHYVLSSQVFRVTNKRERKIKVIGRIPVHVKLSPACHVLMLVLKATDNYARKNIRSEKCQAKQNENGN